MNSKLKEVNQYLVPSPLINHSMSLSLDHGRLGQVSQIKSNGNRHLLQNQRGSLKNKHRNNCSKEINKLKIDMLAQRLSLCSEGLQ